MQHALGGKGGCRETEIERKEKKRGVDTWSRIKQDRRGTVK